MNKGNVSLEEIPSGPRKDDDSLMMIAKPFAYLLGRGGFRRGKQRRRESGRLVGRHKAVHGAGGKEESSGGGESHDGSSVVNAISNETMRRERNEKERERCGQSGVLAVLPSIDIKNVLTRPLTSVVESALSHRSCQGVVERTLRRTSLNQDGK
jgi:hypothetical protein